MLTRSSYILGITAISKGKQQHHMQHADGFKLSQIYAYCNSSKWSNMQTKKYGLREERIQTFRRGYRQVLENW